jgi:hypothetical protein
VLSRAIATMLCVVLVPLVSGCGPDLSYCERVQDHQARLASLAGDGNRAALIQALPIFADLQAAAPDDVADDWQLLVTRVRALDEALVSARVDPATYDPKRPPPGLTAAHRRQIQDAAAQLAASDTQEALANVEQEVLDVCHTPLEL